MGVEVLLVSFGERVVRASSSAKARHGVGGGLEGALGLVHKRAQREVAAEPSPAGKELGRWRQARATGL